MSVIIVSPESGKTGCPGAYQNVGSDVYPWFVNSVSPDGKTVVIERPQVRAIGGDWPCHQHEFTRNPNPITKTLVFRYGAWFIKADDREKARMIAAREFGYKGTIEWAGKMTGFYFGEMHSYRDPSF